MNIRMTTFGSALASLFLLLPQIACTDDGGETEGTEETTAGDGDGDGDTAGDGDGDTAGDGDGDTAGDGDGDTAGDGDGDTAGDGDGDGTQGWVLVGNTRADNVVRVDPETGVVDGEHITAGAGGLFHPDTLREREGMLYVASGDVPEESAILRYDLTSGAFIDEFISGDGLHRPYGFAFGPDGNIYVASFLSDELLRYDAETGDFVDVFATGDAAPDGLNGPNVVEFGPDGGLYVSTQGSVAVDGEPTYPGLPSQILRFDIDTAQSTVYVDQPTPIEDGLGFISMLGVAFGPDCSGGTCDLYTTDFAGGLRRYDDQAQLVWEVSTSYAPGASTGALSFGANAELYVPGFIDEMNPGALLRYDVETGDALPGEGFDAAIFAEDAALVRPIGVLYIEIEG